MKYKRLAPEELKALEKEFVNFLASAQITGPDWVKMKKEEKEKANELIDVFSDLVYDKVLRKIRYLEYRDKKTLNIFFCDDNKINLVGIRVKEHSSLDLTAPDILKQWNSENNSSVNVVRSEKSYSRDREIEVLEMLESGCLITDDRLYNVLSQMH
jgi:hypothetical protein